ncbi:MAG TPA: hypothetical protein VM939_08940 [Gemmatimonadaceae bacterium]|nr:hypothetical protein [Gemmatimonadaceae bacterium]
MEGTLGFMPIARGRVRLAMKLAVSILFAVASAAGAQATPIDITMARAYFEELRQLGQSDAGKLWGRAVSGPMIFVHASSRTVVANEADANGLLSAQDGVWVGRLPPDMNAANTGIDFGGKRWSMVMWPVSDSKYARRRLLMHESFHRIQPALSLSGPDRSNAHLSTANGRIWTRLEWRALTEALLRTGAERKQALIDALVFRARRRTLSPTAAEDERILELNEGLAEYTGLVLSGLPRGALHDRAAVQLAQYEQQESFVRSFAYASGPAYALLLDAAGIPWRRGIRASSDLSAMTAQAYGIGRVEASLAEKLTDRYSGARMIADERARDAARVQNEVRLRARFVDGPTLTLPIGNSFSFSFDPNGAVSLPGVGTVYETSRITDEWGILEVTSGGVLLLRKADGIFTGVVVPAPKAGQTTVGEGWLLTPEPRWSVQQGVRKGDLILRK